MSNQNLPSGVVTIMFTDIEGSTKLWDQFQERFQLALETHNRLMREAIEAHFGHEIKTIGDSFMVAFSDPLHAANCAIEMQRLIEGESFPEIGGMRVRIGLNTGELIPQNSDYFGPPVNQAARIEGAAHGGQIVLSLETSNAIAGRLATGVALSLAGLFRLKDLGSPIQLFVLSSKDLPVRDYPPLRTLNLYPNNLPAELTHFVGREREVQEVDKLLQEKRFVVITGAPGVGKSRLALQAGAESVHRHPDGICLVDMNEVSDTAEVLAKIASVLNIEAPNFYEESFSTVFLRDKRTLLILAHCHPDPSLTEIIEEILNTCPHVRFLVASQKSIRSLHTTEYELEPFAPPPPDLTLADAMNASSVRLFVETAQSLRPSFELSEDNLKAILEICSFLAGNPGDIERSARRVRGMTPQQILPRLRRE